MITHSQWNGGAAGSIRRHHSGTRRDRSNRGRLRPRVEGLECRQLLATVSVNAGQVIRPVDTQLLGVNVSWWDSNLNTPQTQQMVQAAGLTMFRFPGGSSSDSFHFNSPPSYNGQGTDGSMASFIASAGGTGLATIDYGSGSPQEAAAFLAYLEAPVGSTTPIGNGQEWSDSANAWQTVNWQNAGYWASLRAHAPLAQDDGLNFLRLDHPAPFSVAYWEVGNEEYGGWEIDHHAAQHDPATYIAFAKQFAAYAAQIDPNISIGVDVGSPGDNNNWTSLMLQQCASQGFTPGFLSDHNYVQAPGSESDSNLLLNTVSNPNGNAGDPGNPYDWAVRAADYQALLTRYLGASGSKVQLLTTEFNSVYSNPGKQTTSLVNGLFVADSLGALLETPYNGADVWDLRNSWSTGGNNSSSLYGWRQGGDYGLIGSPGGSAPATGPYVPYPTYFAEQLASKIIQAGGKVVQAASSDPNLAVYSVLEPTGHLDLLVINKSPTGSLTGQFQLANFQPASQAQAWQYGEAQDTAQGHTTDGQSALASFTATLGVSGSSFSYAFPAYSMTVLDLGRALSNGGGGPTITQAASASPSPVMGVSTTLSVGATDPSGTSGLTYTWATTGTPPAPVHFSVDGTNAAHSVVATFSKAGTYTFQVDVSDPSGYVATSSVTVVVDQTLAMIRVSPSSVTIAAGGQQSFSGIGYDQFGNPMAAQPALSWSVASGVGTITTAGVYHAPNASGSAVVRAASGSIAATASVTVAPPAKSSASVVFTVYSAWNTGFDAGITLTNTGTTTINGWTLQFQFSPSIYDIWNAVIASHTSGHYVLRNASYNGTIAPGQSVSIGFLGTPGGRPAAPTGYLLNGVPIGSGITAAALATTSSGTAPIKGHHARQKHEQRLVRLGKAGIPSRAPFGRSTIHDRKRGGLLTS